MEPRQQRAAVLIVVLGVLLVLALIATVFATLSTVERAVTRNYMDSVRAQITAQSGLDHAFTLLRQNPTSKAILYWGNNTTETGDPDSVTPSRIPARNAIATARRPDRACTSSWRR